MLEGLYSLINSIVHGFLPDGDGPAEYIDRDQPVLAPEEFKCPDGYVMRKQLTTGEEFTCHKQLSDGDEESAEGPYRVYKHYCDPQIPLVEGQFLNYRPHGFWKYYHDNLVLRHHREEVCIDSAWVNSWGIKPLMPVGPCNLSPEEKKKIESAHIPISWLLSNYNVICLNCLIDEKMMKIWQEAENPAQISLGSFETPYAHLPPSTLAAYGYYNQGWKAGLWLYYDKWGHFERAECLEYRKVKPLWIEYDREKVQSKSCQTHAYPTRFLTERNRSRLTPGL